MKLSKKQTQIGKKLFFILRHDIVNSGLECDSSGYVKVNDLITKKLIEYITIDELKQIVENNDKKRFLLVQINNEYYIKANQGHSLSVGNLIDDDTTLELLTEPLLYCAHGTEEKYIESIYKNGLNRGLRKHIHLVDEIMKEKQTSGFKNKSDRIILINMDQCIC
jgi:RNA:NAD 2'-phosphotransferase (TPT1/KptA family)